MTTSAVFIGDGSLLVQCAEAFRRAGHAVAAVVSGSAANLDWARAQGIPAVRMEGEWAAALDGLQFDYLFSVANLRMLPPAVLARAGKLAINFHDALLPRYAGLNATCWALMAQERVHGVTWHEMTARADAGRIVRQASFELSPEETALSLNAKCYEAGLAAFTLIAEDLARGDLPLQPQQGERQYFGRHKRPALLGTLDFARPATELAALVRALDVGQYANPLGRAKVLVGDRLLLVRSASVVPAQGSADPGTVLQAEGGTLRVAAIGGDLLLGGCTDLEGRPGLQGLTAGAVLAPVPEAARGRLAERAEAIARGEQHWTEVLHHLVPVELPYPRRAGVATGAAPQRFPLGVVSHGASTVAAFLAWLSAVTGQERVSLLYTDAALADQAQQLQPWLSPWVPMTAATTAASTTLDLGGAAEVQMAQARSAGPLTRDLPLRLGERQWALPAVAKVALATAPQDLPAGCELLLVTEAGGHGLELVLDGDVYSADTGLAMASQLAAWLQAFAASAGRVGELALVPAAEQEDLQRLNATGTAFDADGCVHVAIAAQAARTPDQQAVTTGAESLTYAELDAQSTALAHRLAARGVR
ncbi:MAG: formyltransferase family protein, partial [Ramlibacter sp.]